MCVNSGDQIAANPGGSPLERGARVQDALRVECLLDPPVQLHRFRAQLTGQPGPLEPPDPVFAGDRAAQSDRDDALSVGTSS